MAEIRQGNKGLYAQERTLQNHKGQKDQGPQEKKE
jgi:hypothetical protein